MQTRSDVLGYTRQVNNEVLRSLSHMLYVTAFRSGLFSCDRFIEELKRQRFFILQNELKPYYNDKNFNFS